MKKQVVIFDYFLVFFVALFSIALELFLTRILNLKAWNHVVYIVIPFAILGYGIGANIYLIFKSRIESFKKQTILGVLSACIGIFSFATIMGIIHLPVRVDYLVTMFTDFRSILMLTLAYTIFMVPFAFIGFLIVYIFSKEPKECHKLYFVDLVGAGLGAVLFFVLINHFEVVRSLTLLIYMSFVTAIYALLPKKK